MITYSYTKTYERMMFMLTDLFLAIMPLIIIAGITGIALAVLKAVDKKVITSRQNNTSSPYNSTLDMTSLYNNINNNSDSQPDSEDDQTENEDKTQDENQDDLPDNDDPAENEDIPENENTPEPESFQEEKNGLNRENFLYNNGFQPLYPPGYYNNDQPVYQPQKPKLNLSSSTVMLLIGTIFIILSGIAFGVAGWVKTSPEGRVGIMMLASAAAFTISTIFMKVFKLDGTSTAFFTVGSIFTSVIIITAGWYKLLGDWLAVGGDGAAMLYAIAFGIGAASTFIGWLVYKKIAFVYISLSAMVITLMFAVIQFTVDFREFAAVLVAFQMIITASLHGFELHKGSIVEKPLYIIGNIASVLFGILGTISVLSYIDDPHIGSYVIISLMIVQLIFYGIFKNYKFMLGIQTLASILLCYMFTITLENNGYEDNSLRILFGFMILAVYLVNRFIPQLRTAFSEFSALSAAVLGALLSITVNKADFGIVCVIVPLAVSIIIKSYVFSKNEALQTTTGFFAPLLPLVIAFRLDDVLRVEDTNSDEVTVFIFGLCALFFIGVSAALVFLPKYAFGFYAKHPIKSDMLVYVNMTVSAVILFFISEYTSMIYLPLAAAVVHHFVADKLKNNYAGIGSAAAALVMINNILHHFIDYDGAAAYVMLFVFALIMAASKFRYRNAVVEKSENKVRIDTLLIGGGVSILLFADSIGTREIRSFMLLITIAIYIACFIKKNTNEKTASVLLSISAFVSATALVERPFFVADSDMINSKINLGIIALLGAAYKFIWRKNNDVSKSVSTTLFILSFAGLILDAMRFHESGNTIFVLAVTVLILMISFFTKSKTWFTASSIALAIITVYSSVKYLRTLQWWVYLFAAGIILIAIASVNEYYKKQGSSVKTKMASLFADWKW